MDHRAIFARKEIKYRLSPHQLAYLRDIVSGYLQHSEYGIARTNSLYFDTAWHSLICRSLEKPIYKEKLRLRWYECGGQRVADPVFLELKKKFKGIVYKRRCEVPLMVADALAESDDILQTLQRYEPETNVGQNPQLNDFVYDSASGSNNTDIWVRRQILAEIVAFCSRHDALAPAALISCCREAFGETDESGMRVTFDTKLVGANIRSSDDFHFASSELYLERHGVQLMQAGEAVMEVKCSGAYPIWLTRALSASQAYPTSFSKYGELAKRSSKGALPYAG